MRPDYELSIRAGVKLIPANQHILWPFFRDFWKCSSDALIPENRLLELGGDEHDVVVVPKGPSVYVFETELSRVTWYRKSNLIAVEGALYAIISEHNHLLGSYAWLACGEKVDADYVTIYGSGMRYKRTELGEIKLSALHIHRCTGKPMQSGCAVYDHAHTNALLMRPSEPWYTPGFYDRLHKGEYSKLNLLNSGKIERLQKWIRSKLTGSNKESTVRQFRNHGWLRLLNDDLFELVCDWAFRFVQSRLIERRFSLPLRSSPT